MIKRVLISCGLFWAFALTNLAVADLPDFKSLVKKSAPSVVNISTVQNVTRSQSIPGLPGFEFRGPNGEDIPEIFRHFFQMPEFGQSPQRGSRKAPRSLGSGFIVSSDGYILTNHHVIKGADQVLVRLNDRRELEAKIIGSDERSDVALLKIDAEGLTAVEIGESAEVEQGEWVLAIGSPFGFDQTVTSGIVSATGRALENETYVPFIQTDVAINPGNSGGPLFNLDGEVIGINSQIYTRSGGFMGLSFAIPIDVAMEVADQLKTDGYVTRGWLGVVIQEVNKDLAESFDLDKPAGALIVKVLPDSPAEKGGLREGDIILTFEGNPITISSDLPHQVGRVRPGTSARLDIQRDGKPETLSLEIGALPENDPSAQRTSKPTGAANQNRLNITVADLSTAQKEKLKVADGVVIQQVFAGAGEQAGLVQGDIITMLNGERVDSARKFSQLVKSLPSSRSVPMRIVRRGNPVFIPLRLPK